MWKDGPFCQRLLIIQSQLHLVEESELPGQTGGSIPASNPHRPSQWTGERPKHIRCPISRAKEWNDRPIWREKGGFSCCLIRSALLRQYRNQDVFISARKSMMLCVFMHSRSKRADTIALLDLGATENFMSLQYAKYLHLPIKVLKELRKLFNVDRTPNQAGDLKYYTNLHTRTRTQQHTLRYFLSNLGENKVILGYP